MDKIVIGTDKVIVVPEELKKIAVQYEHNARTIEVSCPRFWGNLDLSKMQGYINYMSANGEPGKVAAENMRIDKDDSNTILFDWSIKAGATKINGPLAVLICFKSTDENGDVSVHWESELCKDFVITEGMDCGDVISDMYPDVITQILLELNELQTSFNRWEFKGITFEDVRKDVALNNYKDVEVGVSSFSSCFSFMNVEGHCVYETPMKRGESFVLSNAFVLTSNVFANLIITDKNGIIRYIIPFSELNATRGLNGCYTFDEDGMLHLCFDYTAVNTAEFFYIRKPNANHPLTIYAEHADFYMNNSNYGDKAMDAIMTGRQILVRTPNADSSNHTAIYSPVYMYQLPNKMNDYLYLFYLKDEKQTIDLSAMGMGVIQMPVYGELKLLLSKTYNACPVEG